eukprot:m.342752 g.342752  ORF g.342752 m.342752 type:complete len:450 (-) comp21790_c0_seq1:84-1433(-)
MGFSLIMCVVIFVAPAQVMREVNNSPKPSLNLYGRGIAFGTGALQDYCTRITADNRASCRALTPVKPPEKQIHCIRHAFVGYHGWIPQEGQQNAYVGYRFVFPVELTYMKVHGGRDRNTGNTVFYYTTVPNPGLSTPTSSWTQFADLMKPRDIGNDQTKTYKLNLPSKITGIMVAVKGYKNQFSTLPRIRIELYGTAKEKSLLPINPCVSTSTTSSFSITRTRTTASTTTISTMSRTTLTTTSSVTSKTTFTTSTSSSTSSSSHTSISTLSETSRTRTLTSSTHSATSSSSKTSTASSTTTTTYSQTSSRESSSSGSQNKNNSTRTVAIVVGVICVICIVFLVVFFIFRKKKLEEQQPHIKPATGYTTNPSYVSASESFYDLGGPDVGNQKTQEYQSLDDENFYELDAPDERQYKITSPEENVYATLNRKANSNVRTVEHIYQNTDINV